jgi:hypothetical protein
MVVVITNDEWPAADDRNYAVYAEMWQRKFGFPVPIDLARRWWPKASALTDNSDDAILD